jgi:hypothetical protein
MIFESDFQKGPICISTRSRPFQYPQHTLTEEHLLNLIKQLKYPVMNVYIVDKCT